MSALCEHLDEHRDAVEGDLHELYGIDIADVFRGSLSPRRALMFVERALHDPRSRLRAELLGDTRWIGWTQTDDALADLVDISTATFTVVARGLGAKTPQPAAYTRPTAPNQASAAQRHVRAPVAPDLGSLDLGIFD